MALYFLSASMLCSLWSDLFPNFYLLSFLYIYLSPILRVTPRRLSIHSIHSQNTCFLSVHTFSQYIHPHNTYILWIHMFSQYICSLSTYMLSKHTFYQYIHTFSQYSLGKSKSSRVPCHCQRERVHLSAPVQTSDSLGCRAVVLGTSLRHHFAFLLALCYASLLKTGLCSPRHHIWNP